MLFAARLDCLEHRLSLRFSLVKEEVESFTTIFTTARPVLQLREFEFGVENVMLPPCLLLFVTVGILLILQLFINRRS